MKRISIFILISTLILAAGCGPLGLTSQEKAEQAARTAAFVKNSLDSRKYCISVNRMFPRRGTSKSLSTPYSVKVEGNKLHSYLPYAGVAYSVPYGGGKALNFDSDIVEYREDFSRSDRRTIVLSTDNGEDFLIYTITVFDNGKADIDIRSRNREGIGFSGEIDETYVPDAKN